MVPPHHIADALLVLHAALAAFIVLGPPAVWIGARRGWRWVRRRRWRQLHLLAIVVVATEAVLGYACPLTLWENWLRGDASGTSFIGRWLGRLLYLDLPAWSFTVAYLSWAAVSLLTWQRVPPQSDSAKQ
jgi:hypothetical protein